VGLQQRQQSLSQEKRPFEVHIQQAVELGLGDRFQGIEQSITGVIHQPTQATYAPGRRQRPFYRLGKTLEGADVSHIQWQRDRLAACNLNLLHYGVCGLWMAVVSQDHAHALPGTQLCSAGTNATAAAGDKDNAHVWLHCLLK
jgi:hypothetical protein